MPRVLSSTATTTHIYHPFTHPHAMQIEIRDISPTIAAEMLATNATNNRRKSRTLIRQYARDMSDGHWEITGEAIKFDTNGRLIDGQHRLTAVIQSGATVKMAVITGLEPHVMHVIDTGKSRTGADALTISGEIENANVVAALARKIIGYQAGQTEVFKTKKISIRGVSITNRDILGLVCSTDLQPFARFAARTNASQIARVLSVSEWAFVYWLLCQTDEKDAETFLTKLATLDNVPLHSPIRTLFDRLTKSAVKLTGKQTLMAVIAAWNAWRTGSDLARIKVSNMDEAIPVPV